MIKMFTSTIGAILISLITIALIALLGGTIVYWLWPIAIPAAFPGLVASGTLAAKITFWPAVALNWLFILLIKDVNTK